MLGGLPVVALALCAWAACSDDKPADKAPAKSAAATPIDLGARCKPLAQACGDTDKHIAKMLDECSATAKAADQKCAAEAAAVYECYETQLCGKGDKVWTLDDLRVLAERHGTCAGERQALRDCAAK
jgi:hypothetical protein